MDTTNSSENQQRRIKHGQRPTEPLAGWPAEFGGAPTAESAQPAATSGDAPADGWPSEIYLNAGDDPLGHFDEYADVSWCDHPQGENDVRYVRAELARIERTTAHVQPVNTSSERVENAAGNEQVERAASGATASGDELPPLTMSVYGTRTNLELERQRRADIAARAAVSAATKPTADLIPVPRATLEKISDAMSHMGDQLNKMDVAEEADEDKCAPVFDAISALLSRNPVQNDDALRYATNLARALWRDHYASTAPQWEPMSDLMGVLSQIDNMITGWPAAAKPSYDLSQLERVRESYRGLEVHSEGPLCWFADVQSLLATKPAAAQAVPEGFVIVPINPTPAMNRAAVEYINGAGIYSSSLAPTVLEIEEAIYHEVYRAMLAATPAASTTGAAQTAEEGGAK